MAILMKRFVATCCVTLLLGLICRSAAAEKIVILPKQIKLATKVARQTVLIQRQDSQGRFIGQTKAKIESSNPKVVVVENGVARPVGDGVAYLSVVSGKHKATAKVVVSNQKKKSQKDIDPKPINSFCQRGMLGKGLSIASRNALFSSLSLSR